jgi:quercetin dioxygenase-like cupin family protein
MDVILIDTLRHSETRMNVIERIDASTHSFDSYPDLSIQARKRKPGPPERIAGMTVGIVEMAKDAPHGGEVHPDGDEVLYVIEGKLRVLGDSSPEAAIELEAGDACIIPKGEWHVVQVIEPAKFVHITPGPNGDHRP